MSFLQQLKTQAKEKESQLDSHNHLLQANTEAAEFAASQVLPYFSELCAQLNVLLPSGPPMAVDHRSPWPPTVLNGFVYDARKKMLNDREVYDHVSMGWRIRPQHGTPVAMSTSANFPPELEKIERRIAAGNIPHEKVHVRHPQKNTLIEVRFDYRTEARGTIMVTVDHHNAKLHFRLAALRGLDVQNVSLAATDVNSRVLDELAKVIVGQPSAFM